MSHLKANRQARVYANKGGRASLGATDHLVLALVIMFELRHLPLIRVFFFLINAETERQQSRRRNGWNRTKQRAFSSNIVASVSWSEATH